MRNMAIGQPPPWRRRSCLTACAGLQDPSRSPDRAQLRVLRRGSQHLGLQMFHFGFISSLWWLTSRRLGAVVGDSSVALLAPLMLAAPGARGPRPRAVRERRGPLAPRVSARSEIFELVGILRGERLVIYLDRFASNEPVTTADIAVTIGDATEAGERRVGRRGHLRADVATIQDRGADRAGVLDHRRGGRRLARGNADGAAGRWRRRRAHPRSARCAPGWRRWSRRSGRWCCWRWRRRRWSCTAATSCSGAISCRRRRWR